MVEPNPALLLHPGTFLFAISMFGFLLAGLSWSTASAMPDHRPALLAWSKAMVCAGGGFLLYYLRGHAPWFLSFVVANLLVVACGALGHVAYARLLGALPRRRTVSVVAAIALSGVLATYGFDVPIRVSVITVSGSVALTLGMTGALLTRHAWTHRTASSAMGALITVTMSAGFAMRTLVAVFGDASNVLPNSNTPTQLSSLVVGAVFVVASSICFLALVHEQQRSALLEAASRDSLTGVRTRAAFFEQAVRLDKTPERTPYAVLMVDIDRFKSINDTHGHAAGDVTLAHAGRLLANAVRISDVVGRYGGEEFSILLRDCGEEQAVALARRIVAEAAGQTVRLADGRTLAYTVSAGCAVADTTGPRPEPFSEVIERADQALFRAKREGRNRAVAASPPHDATRNTIDA